MEFEELKKVRTLHQATFVYLIPGPTGIRYLHIFHNTPCLPHPLKKCAFALSLISLGTTVIPQEKIKTQRMCKILGGKQARCIVGVVQMTNWKTVVPGRIRAKTAFGLGICWE